MLDTMFATETMAELSARQGRLADAMAIYRHLIAGAEGQGDGGAADAARVVAWKGRLAALEAGSNSAPGTSSESPPQNATSVGENATSVRENPVGENATSVRSGPVATIGRRPSLVVSEPVRSGQVIYADGRDLIVVASVNSGAQVLADGNIHIYGALKGRAVAGAQGQRDAQVFCLALEAELIGVDTGYLLSDDISPGHWGTPARVALTPGGTCTVTTLTVGKPAAPGRPMSGGLKRGARPWAR